MTTPRTVTTAWLKSNKACPDAIGLFCAEWPEGCEVTHDNLVRADALGLSLGWFARRVLPPQVFAAYEDSRSALLADYRRYRSALYDDYKARCADFLATRDALYADYLVKRSALIISFLLNHFAALPAKQRRKKETK